MKSDNTGKLNLTFHLITTPPSAPLLIPIIIGTGEPVPHSGRKSVIEKFLLLPIAIGIKEEYREG